METGINLMLSETTAAMIAGMSDEERNMALMVSDARTMGERWLAAHNAKIARQALCGTPSN